MVPNERMITIKLKRCEVSRLMLACTIIRCTETLDKETCEHWKDLHDKLRDQLIEFDAKHGMLLYCASDDVITNTLAKVNGGSYDKT